MVSAMTKLDEALGLFPSVIKCGEHWSSTCQSVLDEAKAELASLRAALAAPAVAPAHRSELVKHLANDPVHRDQFSMAQFRKREDAAATPAVGGEALRDCLQSIADMSQKEPREPDDADWRFRCLEAIRAAKTTLAATPVVGGPDITHDMEREGQLEFDKEGSTAKKVYCAMIAVAPAAPAVGREREALSNIIRDAYFHSPHGDWGAVADAVIAAQPASSLRGRNALLAAREYIGEDNNPRSNRVLQLIFTALSTVPPRDDVIEECAAMIKAYANRTQLSNADAYIRVIRRLKSPTAPDKEIP